MTLIPHFIDGELIYEEDDYECQRRGVSALFNPSTGESSSLVIHADEDRVNEAVAVAKKSFSVLEQYATS